MKAAREWMAFLAYTELERVASDTVLSTVAVGLSGIARHGADGIAVEWPVYLRCAPAPDGNGYYIDLCDDQWRAVHVTPSGWRIIDEPPVRFRRSQAMRPLPVPDGIGDISALWRVANVAPQDRLIVLAWMLEAWRHDTPYPILELLGGQGTGKSDVQVRLRQLIDPNAINLRAAPKDVESIHVGTRSNHLGSYNNISRITTLQQDAFCTLSTGGGHAKRTLYTDADETVIESRRPVILNGINPLATAQDMIDRCVRVELPPITGRRKASDLESDFDACYPVIFGGMLDLFSRALGLLPSIEIGHPPRMADFAELGQAVYQAEGHAGDFTSDYLDRQKEAIASGIEASPAAAAILDLAEKYQSGYEGTLKGLLDTLTRDFKRDNDGWPKSARGFSDILRRQAPALLTLGVSIELDPVRKMDGYHVRVKKFFRRRCSWRRRHGGDHLMLLAELEEKGIRIELDGENLRVFVNGGMNEEQRQWMKTRKLELLAELNARRLAYRRRAELLRVCPFRNDLTEPGRKRPVPTPDTSWTSPQWQAYVGAGNTAGERLRRLRQVPHEFRRRVISHVRT